MQINENENIEYIYNTIENIEDNKLESYKEYQKFYAIGYHKFNMNLFLDDSILPNKSIVFLNDVFCHSSFGNRFLKIALNDENGLHYYGKIRDIHIRIKN